jgi:hypothetical protein
MAKYIFILLMAMCGISNAAECTIYELSHPLYILTGAHLSTGKCSTCASCHINRIFMGTPKTCIACHNGDPSRVTVYRPSNHIPTGTMDCGGSCHTTITFAGGMVVHSQVTAIQCKTCHTGTYLGATGKPTNHIPESQLLGGLTIDCNLCHKSTTAWTTTMNHNASVGSGAGWCKGCHQTGQTWLGAGQRMTLTHFQRTPIPLDCSQVGCHRPLGNRGSMYVHWDN